MKMANSPEYIKTSLAAAISLGLEKGSFKNGVRLTGLNLLLTYDNGCAGKCAYCGVTQNIKKDDKASPFLKRTFIRVKWPVYSVSTILESLKKRVNYFERICISMATHRRALKDTVYITKK